MPLNNQPSVQAASDEALAWVMRRHAGPLPAAAERAFTTWLAQSPAHQAAWAEAEALWRDAGALQRIPSATPAAAIQRGAPAMPMPLPLPLARRRQLILASGAVLAAGLGGAGWYATRDTGWAAHSTGTGETRRIALEDGSEVFLNARSTIALRTTPGQRRLRLLKGEASITVAAAPNQPFLTDAGHFRASTMAARFDLAREMEGPGSTSIAMANGTAALSWGDAAPQLILGPGEAVQVDANGQFGPRQHVKPATLQAWQRGLLIAENTPLAGVLQRLNAYYRGWILLPDPHLAGLRVSAVLELRDLDQSLRLLSTALPLHIRRPVPMIVLVEPA